MNAPAEILTIWEDNGVRKANLPVYKMIILGIMAGVFIGFGAHVFVLSTSVGETAFEGSVAKFMGAAMFPCGLMMVIMCGAELFTGNNLLTLAIMRKKVTWGPVLRNWVVVYLSNLAGSVIIAFLFAKSGLYTGAAAERAIAVAGAKVAPPFLEMILRGFLCNTVVVLACWFQAGSKELIGKIFAIWFPIMLFVYAGFEHSIANMTYIPLGMFLGADVSLGQMFGANLIPVTIGNMLGGAVFVPFMYHFAYRD